MTVDFWLGEGEVMLFEEGLTRRTNGRSCGEGLPAVGRRG